MQTLFLDVPRAMGGSLKIAAAAWRPEGPVTGPPVLLVHGFASSRRINWEAPGWIGPLTGLGRQVLAFDHRGHGQSDASYDPADYAEDLMAGDCVAVLDAFGASEADVIGYSMGAFAALAMLAAHPSRIRKTVLAGIGANYLTPPDFAPAVPDALLTDDPALIADPGARGFRVFADKTGADRRALAACWNRPRGHVTEAGMARFTTPVLVICGALDTITGPPEALARHIPGALSETVPGRDHMTAVGDKVTKAKVLAFLSSP